MPNSVNFIIDQALELSATERADIAEKLLSSLDTTDEKFDALWADEANSRIEAFNKGEIESVSSNDDFC